MLYKTTIAIWTDYDPAGYEIDNLAREAMVGDAYCSLQECVKVDDPESDPHPPNMEFFGDPSEDAKGEETEAEVLESIIRERNIAQGEAERDRL